MHDTTDRVFNLLDSRNQAITNMSLEEAIRRVSTGKADEIRAIQGSFALLSQDGIMVRMARTLDRPMRFFLAKKDDGPALVVADRIDTIQKFLKEEELGDQFHPSYTRMVPAHYVTEVELRGCPDPSPVSSRFFTPVRSSLPPDLDIIGQGYIQAVYDEITSWLKTLDEKAPIGISFSGGVDSGSVLLLLHHALGELRLNRARLKAFTLCIDGRGEDLEQARRFLEEVGLGLYHEPIEIEHERLDVHSSVAVLEDYKPLDVESGTMCLALLEGIRRRYPDWRYMVDGEGGNENLKDYPIEENPELTIKSVLSNPLLYQEGWGVGALKHSSTYSGGQSRSHVRSYAPLRHFGFDGFSPYTRMNVIAVAEAIPFIELTKWSVSSLYKLKGEIVSRGIEGLTGLKMPVFEKRRFQHGAMEKQQLRVFSREEATYRQIFNEIYG